MQIVMRVNTDCMRVKITWEGIIKMNLKVTTAKGETIEKKVQQVPKGNIRCIRGGNNGRKNKRHSSEQGTARVTREKRCR